MKFVKIGLLVIICIASAGVAYYRTAAAIAEGHECCGKAPAANPTKVQAASKRTAAATSADKGDADAIARQKPAYPLDTCVVLANKLGQHGEAVDYVYKERLVRFCCKRCIATFERDPAKYLAKLDEAAQVKEKAKAEASSPKSTGEADRVSVQSIHTIKSSASLANGRS
jgi:hypothetical protein